MRHTIYPKHNAGQQASIMILQCSFNGNKYPYSTGVKINNADLAKYWIDGRIKDCIATRAKQTTPEGRTFTLFGLNDGFDRIKKIAYSTWEHSPNWQDIREALDKYFGKAVKQKEKPVSGFYELLDKLCEAGFKRDLKGLSLADNSVKNYIYLRSLLSKYDREKFLTFEDWNVLEWNKFRNWMENNRLRKSKEKKGLNENSIMVVCRILKAVINEGVDKDLTITTTHRKKGFTATGKDSHKIYLTTADIEKLYNTKIENKQLKIIRDYFMLSTQTGLRFSDWSKMHPNNYIEDGKFLEVIPEKTKKHSDNKVRILLSDLYKKIIRDNGGYMPALPAYHKVVIGIKVVARIAELENAESCTPHVGRTSLVTNKFMSGMNTTIIRTITGHKSNSFEKYLKVGLVESGKLQEQHAKEVQFGGLKAVK